MVHDNPEQMKLLLDKIDSYNTNFIIHLDKRANLDKFKSICPESVNLKIELILNEALFL